MKIEKSHFSDVESECYSSSVEEGYIKTIFEFSNWEKYPRKLRFALPEMCLYSPDSHPFCFVSKRKETGELKVIKDQSKMHRFEIIRFLL